MESLVFTIIGDDRPGLIETIATIVNTHWAKWLGSSMAELGGKFAGMIEVAGPIGQIGPVISPGYGFTAIIVAFLGRLHPIGVIFSGLLMALTYLGGDAAQIELNLPNAVTGVFQGMLLFFLLATDVFVKYRVRFSSSKSVQYLSLIHI